MYFRQKAADYGDDNRMQVACKRNSAMGFENEKFTEHILKLLTFWLWADFGGDKKNSFQINSLPELIFINVQVYV
jgi:hypothetical protein